MYASASAPSISFEMIAEMERCAGADAERVAAMMRELEGLRRDFRRAGQTSTSKRFVGARRNQGL